MALRLYNRKINGPMEKSNTRSVAVVLLIFASIASYVYLNTLGANQEQQFLLQQEVEMEEEVEHPEQKDVILPDVQLLKKALETGKRILPSAS